MKKNIKNIKNIKKELAIKDIDWDNIEVKKISTMMWRYGPTEKSITFEFKQNGNTYVLCKSLESNNIYMFQLR